ncbi:MAG: Holliday junction branch migration protein RuvA [Paraglaciecola sp.]|uniref:Holliday junction branch migration protein RuvA n=1 Tax=Paraglaciecola sp. TaxID=1920173 RepID=UPI00273ED69F|nr:Holliday junction branch migration protein RuvA [Paraglaciecola sp.]MDP5032713.1 Holliday junction branch migration protein RuvA [Paraglaciecola sp.]MDP5132194.1 Holliday junction branch migration protein RuvA [Paraglaciecola sp.]
MIGSIRGILLEKQAPEILIEAGGVGYEVQVPMTSFYQLPDVGQEVSLCVHFVVREDAQLLFGFANKQERAVFRELIKASGVGPKLALTILSGMNAAQFMQAVSLDDVTGLTKLPGVGKKTAERLVIELRDRLTKLSVAPSNTEAFGRLSSLPIENTFLQSNDAKEEALSALVALGYKPAQGSKVINSVYKSEMSSEALIREALRAMI